MAELERIDTNNIIHIILSAAKVGIVSSSTFDALEAEGPHLNEDDEQNREACQSIHLLQRVPLVGKNLLKM